MGNKALEWFPSEWEQEHIDPLMKFVNERSGLDDYWIDRMWGSETISERWYLKAVLKAFKRAGDGDRLVIMPLDHPGKPKSVRREYDVVVRNGYKKLLWPRGEAEKGRKSVVLSFKTSEERGETGWCVLTKRTIKWSIEEKV